MTYDAQWVIRILRTMKPGSIQQISLHVSSVVFWYPPDPEWAELDSFLIQLSDSHPLCLRVVYESMHEEGYAKEEVKKKVGIFLPEVMRRGIAGVVCSP